MSHPGTGIRKTPDGGARRSLFERLRHHSPSNHPDVREPSIARRVAVPFLSRLMTDISTQIWFPFLPFLASGMGMSVPQLSLLVGIRNMCGALVPVWGVLADRFGYLKFLRIEILTAMVGYLLLTLSPTPELRSAGVIIAGIATLAFIPTMVAWMSTRFPYRQRGRALGMLEYAWAVSGIAGVPLAGVLLETFNWKTPFWMLTSGFALSYILFLRMPSAPGEGTQEGSSGVSQARWDIASSLMSLRALIATVPTLAWMVTGFGFLMSLAMFDFLFVFGEWLTETFQLTPLQLSGVVMGMGFADLSGSVAASLYTDRLGKVRSLQVGGIVTIVAFSLLSVAPFHLVATIANLVLLRCGLEYLIVSALAYASEIMPKRRGFMMSIFSSGMFSGSGVSGVVGPAFFRLGGITGIGISSLLMIGVCTVMSKLWFPELSSQDQEST